MSLYHTRKTVNICPDYIRGQRGGGHKQPYSHNTSDKINAWFDYFLEGKGGHILSAPKVEVELVDGTLISQNEWLSEKARAKTLYFSKEGGLSLSVAQKVSYIFSKLGHSQSI